jgi:hypothetical protein
MTTVKTILNLNKHNDLRESLLKPLSVSCFKLESDIFLLSLDEGLPGCGHPLGIRLFVDGGLAAVDLVLDFKM